MSRSKAAAPRSRDTLAIGDAIRGNDALTRLTRRLHESRQRLADVAAALPPALRDQVRAGPLDDQSWTLLAANAAAAAKLRNLLPLLADQMAARGWPPRALRVKTLGAGGA